MSPNDATIPSSFYDSFARMEELENNRTDLSQSSTKSGPNPDHNGSTQLPITMEWEDCIIPTQLETVDQLVSTHCFGVENDPSYIHEAMDLSGEILSTFYFQNHDTHNQNPFQELTQSSDQPQSFNNTISYDEIINSSSRPDLETSFKVTTSQYRRPSIINLDISTSSGQPGLTATRSDEAPASVKKLKRLPTAREKTFDEENTTTKVICIFCKDAGVKCSGVDSKEACQQCQKRFGELAKEKCARAWFYEIVEWGSSFPALALYEWNRAHDTVADTDSLCSVFRGVKDLESAYAYIVFHPAGTRLRCKVNTKILLQITKVAFSIMDNGQPKHPGFKIKQVLSAISAELLYGRQEEFISLTLDLKTEKDVSFLHKAFMFCEAQNGSQRLYGQRYTIEGDETAHTEAEDEIIIDNKILANYASYIAARYCELRLFKCLQEFCRDGGRCIEPGKTQSLAWLMLQVAFTCDSPIELSQHFETKEHLKTGLAQLSRRRRQLSQIFTTFLFTIQSKIDPKTKAYNNISKSNAVYSDLFRNAFTTSSQFDRRYLLLEAQEQEIDFGSKLMKRTIRALDQSVCPEAIRDASFVKLVNHILMSYMWDLNYDIDLRFPRMAASEQCRRRMLSTRLFLCLSAADFNMTPDLDTPTLLLHDIHVQSTYRMMCIGFYKHLKATAKDKDCSSQEYISFLVKSSNSTIKSGPLRRALRRGRRWSDLMDLFGPAIVLIGSPIKDEILPFDIPRIVEEAVDEVFAGFKKILTTYFEWLKQICGKLTDILLDLLRHNFLLTEEYAASILTGLSYLFDPIKPFYIIIGEFRSNVQSPSPQLLINQILATASAPEEHVLSDLILCTDSLIHEISAAHQGIGPTNLYHTGLSRALELYNGHDCAGKQVLYPSYIAKIVTAARGLI